MSRLVLALAVLALSLSGCAVYSDDYAYPGYSTSYYQTYPSYRVYYYDDDDDDRNYYRWHRDRYEDRHHTHYAPGYDGRYQWQDGRRHYDNQDRGQHYDRQRMPGYQMPQQGWDQRNREHDRRSQSSWQRQGGQGYDGQSQERGNKHVRHERSRDREQGRESNHDRSRRDGGQSWSISR